MSNSYAVRYPVGYMYRTKCKFAVTEDGRRLGYIESRKEIYVKDYCRLVKKLPKFVELIEKLDSGENLMIVEIDGPHQESLGYYKEKYNVNNRFIVNDTIRVNRRNIKIMLNDPKHPFGHGYCIAMALLDKEDSWNN